VADDPAGADARKSRPDKARYIAFRLILIPSTAHRYRRRPGRKTNGEQPPLPRPFPHYEKFGAMAR